MTDSAPRRLWTVWRDGRTLGCEIVARPHGYEVRFREGSATVAPKIYPSLAEAEAEGAGRKGVLLAVGWTEVPTTLH